MTDSISSLSKEKVRVPLLEASADPTGSVVQMALAIPGTDPADWITAEWYTDPDGLIWARALIGPVVLKARYRIFIKFTVGSEQIVKMAKGFLDVS